MIDEIGMCLKNFFNDLGVAEMSSADGFNLKERCMLCNDLTHRTYDSQKGSTGY